MMRPGTPYHDPNPMPVLGLFAVASGVFISLPALLVGMLLAPLARGRRAVLAVAALLGVGLVFLLLGAIAIHMRRAQLAAEQAGGLQHAADALSAAWPHIRTWWLLALPLCFAVTLAIELVRRPGVEELRDREQRRTDRRDERADRRARRRLRIPKSPRREPGFELGYDLGGDQLLPTRWHGATLPLWRLRRTVLVIGAPGAGKTVTLARLAYGVATTSDWQIVVIDAKGDPDGQASLAATVRGPTRRSVCFPSAPYDGFRGSGREIANRLIRLIDWAEEGGGTYYRDLSVNLVRLACCAPEGPPRKSHELLARLDKGTLIELWAGHPGVEEIARFRDEHIDACRQRYRSFFDAVHGQLDGDWAFEDAGFAHILLNELLYGDETSKLARFLIEDFKQYVARRKPRDRQVLLIIDEFSAIADGERIARLVEVVRSYGAAVVLAPQAFEGMGGPEAAARILNAAHTVILHAIPEPEAIINAAGTRLQTESSLQHDHGRSTDVGSTRTQHQLRVDPNEVRRLRPGQCFLIGTGRAQKLQIARPPRADDPPAPEPVNMFAPPAPVPIDPPPDDDPPVFL